MWIQTLILLCLLLIIRYKFRALPKNIPPGPWQIPGIGSLLQAALFKKEMPYETFHDMNKKYGPITFIRVGALHHVLLEDVDIIKEVLTDEIWVERYYSKWMEMRSFGKILGVLLVSGNVWKEMRRFSVRTLREFGFGKQKSMETELNQELAEFTSRIESEIGEGGTICMKQLFTVSVVNILWSMIAGRRFCHDDKKLNNLLTIIEEESRTNAIGELTSPIYLYAAFPFLAPIVALFSSQKSKVEDAQARLQSFFRVSITTTTLICILPITYPYPLSYLLASRYA